MPHSWSSPWTPFRAIECQQSSGHDTIAVDVDGKCQFSVGRAPFCSQTWPRLWGGHFMMILSHGAENVHSQVWQRFCRLASQCAITGLGHKTASKILWTTCLTSLLVQKNTFSCCFFSYLELHCHHRSHRRLYIILSEASVTLGTVRNSNFVKQVKYKEHSQQY